MTTVIRPIAFDRETFERTYEQWHSLGLIADLTFPLAWTFKASTYHHAEGLANVTGWQMSFHQEVELKADAVLLQGPLDRYLSNPSRLALRRISRWSKRHPSPVAAGLSFRVVDLLFTQCFELARISLDLAELLARLETAELKLETAAQADELSQTAVAPLLAPVRLTGEAVRDQVRTLAAASMAGEVTSDTDIYAIIAELVSEAEAYVERHREARADLVNRTLASHREAFEDEAKALRDLLKGEKSLH